MVGVRASEYRCVVCGLASFDASIRPDGLCKWCQDADDRRRPTLAEWDALVEQRDRLAAVVKAVQQRDEAIYLTAEDREALGWEMR